MNPVDAEDRAALAELYAAYAHTFDSADADGWASLFMPNGVFRPPGGGAIVGAENLRRFALDAAEKTPGLRHFMSNISIKESPLGAVGRADFLSFRLEDDLVRFRGLGRYEDALVRSSDGSWRFAIREVVVASPSKFIDAPFQFALPAA